MKDTLLPDQLVDKAREVVQANIKIGRRVTVAEILDLTVGRVSIKATTTERLGFTGRREGIAVQAVASIRTNG